MRAADSRDLHKRRAPTINGKSKGEVGKEEGRKEDEGVEIGVLDVVRAMTPLLVIIAVALGMLVVGYMFVPETLSPQNFQFLFKPSSDRPVASPLPPSPPPPPSEAEGCSGIGGAKPLITALKDFSRWKELGSALGLSPDHLDNIARNNEEAELKKRAMLRAWLGAGGEGVEVCWESLVEALLGMGEVPLAREIARTNGVHSDLS